MAKPPRGKSARGFGKKANTTKKGKKNSGTHQNDWKTAAKKPVKNEDLWKRLDTVREKHQVVWEWVKGHAGHPENELADELARSGMEPFKAK